MNTLTNEINEIIKNFLNIINSNILILKKQKKILLQYILKISDYPSDILSTDSATQLIKFLTMLKEKNTQIDEYISKSNNYIKNLNVIKDSKNIENPNILFKDFSEFSNSIYDCIMNLEDFFIYSINYTMLNFEKQTSFESNLTSINIPDKQDLESENTGKTTISGSQISNTSDINLLENTLVISEIQGKVILPYTLNNLKLMLNENKSKYKSINEIIETEYTVPYSKFKNPSFARFKEAFRLVKNKEHGSIKEAFDLGMELLLNYNLHPAIISACKNIDELDIYLDYLSTNELNKFTIFDVKYEIAPMNI